MSGQAAQSLLLSYKALFPTKLNPSDKGAAITLSGGDLSWVGSGAAAGSARTLFSVSSGKWYWEWQPTDNDQRSCAGVALSTAAVTGNPGDANMWVFSAQGITRNNNTNAAYGSAVNSGTVVSVLIDIDGGSLSFWIGGVDQGVAYTGVTGTLFGVCGVLSTATDGPGTVNFGASAFTYTPPAGYNRGFGNSIP